MRQLRNVFYLLCIVAGVAIGVLFALQNKQPVPLDLLVFSLPPRSIALWVLCAFALGGLVGLLVSSIYMLRTKAALGSSRKQLARARAELDEQREPDPGVSA